MALSQKLDGSDGDTVLEPHTTGTIAGDGGRSPQRQRPVPPQEQPHPHPQRLASPRHNKKYDAENEACYRTGDPTQRTPEHDTGQDGGDHREPNEFFHPALRVRRAKAIATITTTPAKAAATVWARRSGGGPGVGGVMTRVWACGAR